jgi:hypothetical protein
MTDNKLISVVLFQSVSFCDRHFAYEERYFTYYFVLPIIGHHLVI